MPRRKQFDPDDVLTKAMRAFWRHGYEATSMQDLVDGMGIGRASIYNTFGSKHDLFVRSLRHYIAWRGGGPGGPSDADSPMAVIMGLFDVAIGEAVQDGSRDGCLMINTALELAPHDEEVAEIVAGVFAATEGMFRSAIERGIAVGEFPPAVDPQRTAQALLALFIGLQVLARSRPEERLLRAIQDQAKELVR